MDGWVDGWIDGWMDGMDAWMHGLIAGRHCHISVSGSYSSKSSMFLKLVGTNNFPLAITTLFYQLLKIQL